MHRKERKCHDPASAASCEPAAPLRLVDFLCRKPVSVFTDTSTHDTLVRMAEEQIGSIIVVDRDNGRPVGIFTLRDLMCRVAIPGANQNAPIAMFMTPEPASVPQTITVSQAAREMGRKELRHMLVTDKNGALSGIVSRTDIYQWMCDSCVSIRRAKAAIAIVRKPTT